MTVEALRDDPEKILCSLKFALLGWYGTRWRQSKEERIDIEIGGAGDVHRETTAQGLG